MARVKDWDDFTCLWVPENFYIGECRVMAGVRTHTTHIEEDGLWFEGTGGSDQMVSVCLSRAWVMSELGKTPRLGLRIG